MVYAIGPHLIPGLKSFMGSHVELITCVRGCWNAFRIATLDHWVDAVTYAWLMC